MQGRSASMMRKELRLPWAGTLLPESSLWDKLWSIIGGSGMPKLSLEGQQFTELAVEQDPGHVKSKSTMGRWNLDKLNSTRN